ncbi:hypothetical protein [Streptomyces nigrescens]|uniref:hypothetical protein n=1 Tax=Streptomyces nigrescens TaxID=1920 RepID=UPI0036F4D2E6
MRWSLSVYREVNGREVHEYSTHQLDSPDRVREEHQLASQRPWVSRIELTEHTRELTRRPLERWELPGCGQPAPTLANPPTGRGLQRYYQVGERDSHPLRTADDVRAHLDWTRRTHEGTQQSEEEEDGGIPDPAVITLLEVTIVDTSRNATLDSGASSPDHRGLPLPSVATGEAR